MEVKKASFGSNVGGHRFRCKKKKKKKKRYRKSSGKLNCARLTLLPVRRTKTGKKSKKNGLPFRMQPMNGSRGKENSTQQPMTINFSLLSQFV